jgi:hypothetical protein
MNGITTLTLICVTLAGHPRFATREAASAGLARMVEVCPSVVLTGESSCDPEIRARCKKVMDAWYAKHAAELVDRMEPGIGWPWCDSLRYGHAGWQAFDTRQELEMDWDREGWNLADSHRFLAQAQQQGLGWGPVGDDGMFHPRSHPWNAYREATRLWMIEIIAQRRDARYFLRCMCEGHLQQARHYGYSPRYGLVRWDRFRTQ